MRARMSLALVFTAFMAIAFAVPACHKGPAEKSGERIDNTIDEATKGHSDPLEKGPGQKAGEDVDKATGNK